MEKKLVFKSDGWDYKNHCYNTISDPFSQYKVLVDYTFTDPFSKYVFTVYKNSIVRIDEGYIGTDLYTQMKKDIIKNNPKIFKKLSN